MTVRHRGGHSWRCVEPGVKWDCWSIGGWYLWRDGDSWWLMGGPEYVEKRMAIGFNDALDAAAEYFHKYFQRRQEDNA